MPTSAIRDVELVTTGTWQASTGPAAITRADLEAMLAASNDELLDRAPVKLGHRSTLNDAIGDGEPAYGWVVPKRIGPSKAQPDQLSLYGDLVGVPAKLAAIIPTAYRRRSVEVAYKVAARSGKAYAAVLTGLALLGVTKPAVKGLADVAALYSAPELEAETTAELETFAGLEGNPAAVAMLSAAAALVTEEQLGELERAAGVRDTADVPPPVDDTDHDQPQQPATRPGGHTMPGIVSEERIRELLAQEQDADVEGTLAALRTTETAPAPTGDPAPTTETAPASAAPAAPATVAASEGEPQTVTLSAGAWAEVQTELAGVRTRRRTELLDNAVRDGRIAPAERAHFAAELEAGGDRELSATTLIGKLAPRFATTAAGTALTPSDAELAAGASDDAWDEFDRQTFGIEPAKA